jgi:lipopolysaccharide export system protein LptC
MATTVGTEPILDGPSAAPPSASTGHVTRWRRGALALARGHGKSSKLVVLMKLLLPAVAAGLIGLIVVWPQLKTDGGRFRPGEARINPGEAEVVRMVNARFHGSDESGRPYVVTAVTATQPTGATNVILMEEPKADITTQDGTWIAMTAESGVFYRDRHQVDLAGGVNIFHDQGYEFRTPVAEIDLKAGTASGNQRVDGQGPFGQIHSEGFRILDRGHRLIFTGKARLVMTAGAGAAANQTASQAQTARGQPAQGQPTGARRP